MSNEKKVNISKWIGSRENLFLNYFFFNMYFWRFASSSESKWFVLVFFFNSRIWVFECSVRVYCPWQIFISVDVSFFCLYKSVSACTLLSTFTIIVIIAQSVLSWTLFSQNYPNDPVGEPSVQNYKIGIKILWGSDERFIG